MNSLTVKQCGELITAQYAPCGPDLFIYRKSIFFNSGNTYFLCKGNSGKFLVICGLIMPEDFIGEDLHSEGTTVRIALPTAANARALMRYFPFTAPVSHKGKRFTMGLGDRLGMASPGHIRTAAACDVFPVLAQQSMRELNLTGRNYDDVLAAAAFAVFQEGYKKGYGADGDHLKTASEVTYALNCGYTMITLDCSEQIDNTVADLSPDDRNAAYEALPSAVRDTFETRYLGAHTCGAIPISISADELKDIVLIYHKAIDHAVTIFCDVIGKSGKTVDFEMSIDETLTPTSPAAHFVVGSELLRRGVDVVSLAPRFCGEFQKGIDYIGELKQFEKEFAAHAGIAAALGYKISVHSGSDKFSVFPIIGKYTKLNVHVKTAGTNWLEAMRIVAAYNPSLYRKMHAYALSHLEEAKKYYHIKADPKNIADIETLTDAQLPAYLNQDDARQVIHITYGILLTAKDENGKPLFHDDFFCTLGRYEDEYCDALQAHIGKHIDFLRSM